MQVLKSMVRFAGAVPPEGISPATAGSVVVNTGVHAVPDVCSNVKLVTSAEVAVPPPPLPIMMGQTRAFSGPDFSPMLPPKVPAPPPPTVRVAVLLGEPGEGVCVVVTPDVVLGFPPTVLLVTLKVTVQLLLAGIVIPLKLRAVAPAPRVAGVVPVQVPPTAPPTALMLDSESVNAPPVRLEPLLLDNVRVATELPPD